MHAFADLDEVLAVLARLAERGSVERLPRQPGEKGERWRQIVGGLEEARDGVRAGRRRAN